MTDDHLFNRYRTARASVEELWTLIRACDHIWATDDPAPSIENIDLGESMGSKRVYGARQRRQCAKCGLIERRVSFEPDRWSLWETAL